VDLDARQERDRIVLSGDAADQHGNKMPFVLRGAQQLWAMPAAAQATVLPLLLSCTEPTRVIQVVDLRQSDLPPPNPPEWLAPPHRQRRPSLTMG
jgi:hypothetical protein